MTERLEQRETHTLLDNEPTTGEVEKAMWGMGNRAVGPEKLPAELFKLFLDGDQALLKQFHRIIINMWETGEVTQQWNDATIKVLFNGSGVRRNRRERGNYRGISLMSHAPDPLL